MSKRSIDTMNLMNPANERKRKVNVTQLLRHLIQAAAFVFFPGLFLSTFNALHDVVTAIAGGTFSFSGLAGQLVLLLIIFLLTALWGRFFCGYLCTFGAMQELTGWISRKQISRSQPMSVRTDRILKYLKYIALVIIVLIWVLQFPVDSSLSPWGVFGMLVSGNPDIMSTAILTPGFALLIAIVAGSLFVERFFCRYLCPLGALFALSSGHRLFRIQRKEESCTGCGLCSRKCAMGIGIHDRPAVKSGECIDCMRCIGECRSTSLRSNPHPAVAGTVAALVTCGLVNVSSITAAEISDSDTVVENHDMKSNESSIPETVITPEKTSERYADGVFTGSGSGFRGEIQVQVTVENGEISDISVLSCEDDAKFFNKAKSGVIAAILAQQSPEVDTVGGATFSSEGIMEAVADALNVSFDSDAENSANKNGNPASADENGNPASGKSGMKDLDPDANADDNAEASENNPHFKGGNGDSSGLRHGRRKSKRGELHEGEEYVI